MSDRNQLILAAIAAVTVCFCMAQVRGCAEAEHRQIHEMLRR